MSQALRWRHLLLAWGVPAAAVLAVSIALTLPPAKLDAGLPADRFSGSIVVAGMPSLLPSPELPSRLRIAVIRDAAAAEFYERPATLDTIVSAWRDALAAVGADARVVPSGQLTREAGARVLVIPSSPCLTIATREAIEQAGARGQGLIITGAVGTHDAGCRELGYGLLTTLTGAARAAILTDRTIVNVAVPRGGPLSADIPPGARIELQPAAQVALRGATRDAIYTDYGLRPSPAGGSPFLDGALTRSMYRGARVVYWGFEPRNVVKEAWNSAIVDLLVRNSAAWAGGLPIAEVEPWPGGHRAAVVLAQDVEGRFSNARFAADSLQAIGVRGTFFLASQNGNGDRRATEQLLRIGEIGSHTESYRLIGGLPPEEQYALLRSSQDNLTTLAGNAVVGLRPPEEQFDLATMKGWLAAGGSYLFGVNDFRSMAPELLPVDGDTLVLLPRTGMDDVAAMTGSERTAMQAEPHFSDDFAHATAMGGVYALSYNSQYLGSLENVPVLARLARQFAADSTIWIETGAEIAGWWKARAQLATTVRMRAEDRLEVTVRNHGEAAVQEAVVRVALPPGRRVAASDAELLSAEPGAARISIPSLAPDETRTVFLRLAPEG